MRPYLYYIRTFLPYKKQTGKKKTIRHSPTPQTTKSQKIKQAPCPVEGVISTFQCYAWKADKGYYWSKHNSNL